MGTVIPLSDASRQTRTFPVATLLIIVVNALVFVRELIGGNAFVAQWAAIPATIFTAHGVVTIFTAMFMHGGWLHIIGQHGFPVGVWAADGRCDGARALRGVLSGGGRGGDAGAGGGESRVAVPTLGASGAIAAVMGAFIVTYPRDRIKSVLWIFIFVRDHDDSGGAADRDLVFDPAVQCGGGGECADGGRGVSGACGRVSFWGGDGAIVEAGAGWVLKRERW